jgi:hypothetical protein
MSMKNSRQYDYEKQQQKTASAAVNVAQLVKIIAYDPAKMTVDVQPISKRLDQGSYESQPPILSVPVSCQRGGGFAMRVNYKPGDVGSVVFCDHDIDNAVAGGAEGEPNTERNHSSSDAVFMGGIATGVGGVSGLPDGFAIGTDDGGIYLAVTDSGIVILGDVEITGNLTVTGDITATGDVVAGGISLKNHTHGGGPMPT